MMQVLRKLWQILRQRPLTSPDAVAGNDDYAVRYARELADFDDCTTVHDLPPIFH